MAYSVCNIPRLINGECLNKSHRLLGYTAAQPTRWALIFSISNLDIPQRPTRRAMQKECIISRVTGFTGLVELQTTMNAKIGNNPT